jgi:predicted NACHT family NTPase
MPTRPGSTARPASADTPPKPFLLGQSLFELRQRERDRLWQAVVSTDPASDSAEKPDREDSKKRGWVALPRKKLLELACDPPADWRRIALVCSPGLGKTRNLLWLEAEINRHRKHRGKQLAFFLELSDLTRSPSALLDTLVEKMDDIDQPGPAFKPALLRKCKQGEITLLLDSLDQAGPDPEDEAVLALNRLLDSEWQACPIWVSGRPHALARNPNLFLDRGERWRFLRVGTLEEPESRFLLDATREEMQRRLQY